MQLPKLESDTTVHTYWTTCSRLDLSLTHTHPKTTAIHTLPMAWGSKSPDLADSLAGKKGADADSKGDRRENGTEE